MQKQISTLLYFLLVLPVFSQAQNLVPNGDFEYYSSCPTNLGQLYLCNGWWRYHAGSSDFLHACNTTPNTAGIPANNAGWQYAISGNGYAGLFSYGPSATTEYLATAITPLTISYPYEVSMSVSLADKSGCSTGNLSIWLYDRGPTNTLPSSGGYLPNSPQVSFASYGNITDTQNWVRLSSTFIADSAYGHIIIGGAGGTVINPQPTGHAAPAYTGYAYYYIDSVVIKLYDHIFTNFDDTLLCVGDTISVPYTITHNKYSSTNIFTLQLSDASGNFASPLNIGSVVSSTSGNIPASSQHGSSQAIIINYASYQIVQLAFQTIMGKDILSVTILFRLSA